MAWSVPWNLIGLQVSGDVGGFTVYTDRYGQKVVFPKSPPEEPPSEKRIAQRNRFKLAQEDWQSLDQQTKADLEEMCRRASVPLTGQNLWIHSALTNDADAMRTLMDQTGITTPVPEFIP